jgi:hypothetical protein
MPLDDLIDDVARAMTHASAPDLRARVAARLISPPARITWWHPALAAAATVAMLIAWWSVDDMAPRQGFDPAVDAPEITATTEAQPSRHTSRPAAVQRPSRAAKNRSVMRDDDPMAAVPTLAPVTIEPLEVEPIEAAPPIDTHVAPLQALIVESIHVDPLPWSDQ